MAVAHLEALGLRILERNWRCRYGEIDIVAEHPVPGIRCPALVFVEVKTRTGDGYGGLPEAVTAAKLRRLRRLAGRWLEGHQRSVWSIVRIDVVGIRLRLNAEPDITHLKAVG